MPYLEEFDSGRKFLTAGRTIFTHDITNFAYMSADWHPLHTNEEFARKSDFGGLIAHGPLVLIAAYGLLVRAGLFEEQAVGFLGLKWQMKAPVRPGDTIRVEATVLNARPSRRKPDRGVVEFELVVLNQRDEVVGVGEWTNLYLSRGGGQ